MKNLIEDVSGKNWDEAAVSAIESKTHEDRFGSKTHETPTIPLPLKQEVKIKRLPDMSHSDLHGANLSRADLSGADLSNANLSEARLDRTNLEGADLRGADLSSTHMAGAKVNEAQLEGAIFNQWTDLPFPRETALEKGMIFREVTTEN